MSNLLNFAMFIIEKGLQALEIVDYLIQINRQRDFLLLMRNTFVKAGECVS
jgi:hypothetical protein